MNKLWLLIVSLLTFQLTLSSQNRRAIDSLLNEANTNKNDSIKIEAYNDLVWEYYGKINDSALFYANKAIKLAKRTKFEISLANAYRYAGMVYERLSDYPNALENQQKSLRLYIKNNYEPGEANSLMNIAVIFKSQGEFEKALEYQTRALEICEKNDIKPGIAACLGNLGNIHNQMGQKNQALENYLKAYEIDKELNNDYGIGVSLVNIGSIYLHLKQYEKALDYLQRSIDVRKKIGSTQGLAISYNTLGDVYMAIKNVFRAEECYSQSLKYAKEAGALDSEKDANHGLYTIAKMKQNPPLALSYYEEYVRLKDSIFNTRKAEELSSLKTKYALEKQEFDLNRKAEIEKAQIKSEAALKAKHKDEIAQKEKDRERIIFYAVIMVLILVVIFSIFLYNRFKITSRQKLIIEEKKQEVEYKNKQITDSINYAQRIQSALLPAEDDLKKYFPESFIFFQPKDIVSGDFVWLHADKNDIYFAVADCTGHGVPGGFMSMLGTSYLNEIVIEKKVGDPNEVLNQLREKVITALKQKEDEWGSKDGMDIVFMKINTQTNQMKYAAANNGFYILKEGKTLEEHHPDKMPIGVFGEMKSFTNHTLNLNKGDGIYVFSDGYADQFGGPDGKKFKYNQLEKLIISSFSGKAYHQKTAIVKTFHEWKKDYEQIDDVCLAGLII